MVRKGRYAIWNCKEYELISYQQQYYLQSEDPLELKNGFIQMHDDQNAYIKPVSVKELNDAYEVMPYAMISGYRFSVEGYNAKAGTVAFVTSNPFVKDKINVKPYGQSEYIIEIPKGAIEIREDRIPILGFENSIK